MGKIRVSHKRVPFSFIDDALPKFKAYDAQRQRLMQMSSNRKMSMTSEGAFVGAGTIDLKNCALKDHDVKEEDEEEAEREDARLLQDEEYKENMFVTVATPPSAGEEGEREGSAGKDLNGGEVTKRSEDDKENNSPPPTRLMRGISQLEIPIKRE